MTDGDPASMRDGAPNIVTTAVVVMLSGVDILDDVLSVRTVVWLYGGRVGRSGGGEDCWRECQGVQVCTFRCK